MNISTDEKKAEAVARMELIGVFPETIRQFKDDDQLARVKAFESKHNALVYHIIHGVYLYGGVDRVETECFLYVSDHKEEWQLDREDLDEGQAVCYVYNATDPEMSEFGTIGFKLGPGAGLLRTW